MEKFSIEICENSFFYGSKKSKKCQQFEKIKTKSKKAEIEK